MNTIVFIIILLLRRPIDADYFDLTKEIELSYKAPKFKVVDRSRNIKYGNISVKFALKIVQEEHLFPMMR